MMNSRNNPAIEYDQNYCQSDRRRMLKIKFADDEKLWRFQQKIADKKKVQHEQLMSDNIFDRKSVHNRNNSANPKYPVSKRVSSRIESASRNLDQKLAKENERASVRDVGSFRGSMRQNTGRGLGSEFHTSIQFQEQQV